MIEGLRKLIAKSTHIGADKKLQRMFVDLSGKMTVPSIGGKRNTLIVQDDCTRFTRVYFLGKKSVAASVRIIPSGGSGRRYTIRFYDC